MTVIILARMRVLSETAGINLVRYEWKTLMASHLGLLSAIAGSVRMAGSNAVTDGTSTFDTGCSLLNLECRQFE